MVRISFVLVQKVTIQMKIQTNYILRLHLKWKFVIKLLKGVVEALTLSRWLQPFVQADNFELEKSNIVTMSDASFALNNYYKFMVDHIGNTDQTLAEDVRIQNYGQDVSDEEHEMANEEVRELFNQYVEKLTESGRQSKLIEEEDKELTDEELDTLP